jgi:20S proteasome alpha/beta subunit
VTLVVALCCADGVVLAADGQVTSATPGMATKGETRKLFIMADQFAWGGAGPVGSIQRVQVEAEGCIADIVREFKRREPGAANLHKHIHKIQKEVEEETLGDDKSKAEQRSTYLFGVFCEQGPHVLEFGLAGNREWHDKEGFSAIGSGALFATHSFRSLRHHELMSLNLAQAEALAWRTVDDAIATAAWGLGGVVDLAVVDSDGARMLEPQEVAAVQDTVDLWRGQEVETLGALGKLSGSPGSPASGDPPAEA